MRACSTSAESAEGAVAKTCFPLLPTAAALLVTLQGSRAAVSQFLEWENPYGES